MPAIKVVIHNVMAEYCFGEQIQDRVLEIPVNDDATMSELLEALENHSADVSRYYRLSSPYCYYTNSFPYILSRENMLIWNLPFNETRITDFLHTHQITNDTIRVDIGEPQAGGSGIKEIIDLWQEFQSFIENLAVYITIFVGVPEIIKKIRSKFIKKNIPPHSVLDYIFSNEEIDHKQLACLLKVDEEDIRLLMKGLGYQWDKSKKLYRKQPITDKLQAELSKIRMVAE
jgi:hypothetical protein